MTGLEAPVIAAIIGATAAAGTTTAGIIANRKQKAPAPPKLGNTAPLAGEDTTLKPGQKVNAINTTPQGVLADAKTGRQGFLGG